MKYLFHFTFILLFSTFGFGQNLHKIDSSYLKEGERVLSEFYEFDKNNVYPKEYKLQFFRKFNSKKCFCCGKTKIKRFRNKVVEKRYLNAYD